MRIVTREMFDLEFINSKFAEEIKQKEILEFKLNEIESQIIEIKKKYFNALFVYETMKKENPTLVPNKDVLVQIKTLERDENYLKYKEQIDGYKSEIKKITTLLDKERKRLETLFSFKKANVKKYMNLIEKYLTTYSEYDFDKLFEEIFNNEFNDKILWYSVKWLRKYDILELLVEKSQGDDKFIFRGIIDAFDEFFTRFDSEYFKANPENDTFDLAISINRFYKEQVGE